MMKARMGMPQTRPLADFLPTISIKAKDFAAEMTSVNVQAKDLQGEASITQEHVDNNAAVRKMLTEREEYSKKISAASGTQFHAGWQDRYSPAVCREPSRIFPSDRLIRLFPASLLRLWAARKAEDPTHCSFR